MLSRTINHCVLIRRPVNVILRRQQHDFQRMSRTFQPADVDVEKQTHTQSTSQKAKSQTQQMVTHQRLIVPGAAGTFSILPYMTRSLEKLYKLIDEEMQQIGAQKITMPCIGPGGIWKESGRWSTMGSELFKLEDRHNKEFCLSPTHEEMVTSIVAHECPVSYKRLPIKLYQIGRKFRDERRPKNGLLRGREFEMKDLYCFDCDEIAALETYNSVCAAYDRIFHRLDLPVVKVAASTGAMGGDKSQEFHLVANIGEDILYQCAQCGKGINKELVDEKGTQKCDLPDCNSNFQEVKGIEVAHAFVLGTKYSEVFNATYTNKEQKKVLMYMSCHGIGVTRLLAASLEVLSTHKELRWPNLLAPHQICVIPQKHGYKEELTTELAETLCRRLGSLPNLCNEVMLDDRLDLSIGRRMRQARSSGYPHLVALGKKALEDTPLYEYKNNNTGETRYCTENELVNELSKLKTLVV